MKSKEIYKLIKQAQTENNSMAAYNIFLTHLDTVNKQVASIFRDTPEACEDWTRDEFLGGC